MIRRIVLDTNILSPILRAKEGDPVVIRYKDELVRNSIFVLSPITLCEILTGLYNKDLGNLMNRFKQVLPSFEYVELIREDWEKAGNLRGQLMKEGKKIGIPDALIADQANRLTATVVTDNVDHFKDTANSVENWIR